MPLIHVRDRGSFVRRGQPVVLVMLGACLTLAGCGQALVGIEAGSGVPQTVGSATPGVPGDAPAVPAIETTPGPSVAASDIVGVPESSVPPADSANPAPVAEASVAAPPPPAPEPTIDPAFSNVRLPGAEDRWRYVQVERNPLPAVQTYNSASREILWWYDARLGRPVKLGEVQGDFPVQATFRFRGQEVDAFEVPYQINASFGITLPAATVDQIRQAGYSGEWIEAFIYQDGDIQPR